MAGFTPCLAATATCSFTTSTADGGANQFINSGYIALLNNLNGLPLTADQEFQAGITCNGVRPTPTVPTGVPVPGQSYNQCLATQLTSSLLKIPASGIEQDDHNPQRIQPRSLFDLSLGHDNIFHGDKYKFSLQLTAINIANKYALWKAKSDKSCSLVFPTAGCNPKLDFLDCLKSCAERAKLDKDNFWLHKFRATFATRCLGLGLISARFNNGSATATWRARCAISSHHAASMCAIR